MYDLLHGLLAMSLVVKLGVFQDFCEQLDLSLAGDVWAFGEGYLDALRVGARWSAS